MLQYSSNFFDSSRDGFSKKYVIFLKYDFLLSRKVSRLKKLKRFKQP